MQFWENLSYDGIVRKVIGLIICLAFFLSLASYSYAQELIVNPPSIKYGESVNITVNNLSQQNQGYGITVTDYGGGIVGSIDFATSQSSCKVNNATIAWGSSVTCTGSGPFTLTGILDSKKIGASPDSAVDLQYSVKLSGASGKIANGGFIISIPQQGSGQPGTGGSPSPFTIESVIPDRVSPGNYIHIFLTGTKPGNYTYFIDQRDTNTYACKDTSCNFFLKIKEGANPVSSLQIIDPDGNRQSKLITVLAPTPSPTPLPFLCQEGKECQTAIGPIKVSPAEFVKSIFGILLSLAGGVALVLIIISGYRLMTSQGNPEKIQQAREQLTSAIVGLLFIIFSVTILQVIGVDILHIPGLNP